jgi:nucleoside-diphosphate-sugar epimerase
VLPPSSLKLPSRARSAPKTPPRVQANKRKENIKLPEQQQKKTTSLPMSSAPLSSASALPGAGKVATVTGGTGFVGGELVRQLLQRGYAVRAVTRASGNAAARAAPLTRLAEKAGAAGRLSLFPVPTLEKRSPELDAAVKGATYVFHVASPFRFDGDAEADVLRPAIDGTRAVLGACAAAAEGKPRRVVVTSSVCGECLLWSGVCMRGVYMRAWPLASSPWRALSRRRRPVFRGKKPLKEKTQTSRQNKRTHAHTHNPTTEKNTPAIHDMKATQPRRRAPKDSKEATDALAATKAGIQYDEHDWNETSAFPQEAYWVSKVEAEREAFKCAKEHDLDVATILPNFVLGPVALEGGKDSAAGSVSVGFLKRFVEATAEAPPPGGFWTVCDVRDVAEAHWRAAEAPEADAKGQRFIVSQPRTIDSAFVTRAIKERFPQAAGVIPDGAAAGEEGDLRVVDATKVTRVLGLKYTDPADTVADMAASLLDKGVAEAAWFSGGGNGAKEEEQAAGVAVQASAAAAE